MTLDSPRKQGSKLVSTRSVAGVELVLKSFQSAASSVWHHHDGAYGCLMLSGDVREQRSGTDVELGRGDCTWRPPEERHRFRCGPEGATVLTFEIPEGRLDHIAGRGLHFSSYRHRRTGMIIALGHLLRAELLLEENPSHLTLESLLLDLLAEAASAFDDPPDRVTPGWLERVRDHLHDEKDRRLTLAELAGDAGVHPIHLARTFRRRFGLPLGTYHRRLRLDRALRELMETNQSLTEVALASGFYDQSHFSNVVKRAVGVSPTRLRSLYRSVEPGGS